MYFHPHFCVVVGLFERPVHMAPAGRVLLRDVPVHGLGWGTLHAVQVRALPLHGVHDRLRGYRSVRTGLCDCTPRILQWRLVLQRGGALVCTDRLCTRHCHLFLLLRSKGRHHDAFAKSCTIDPANCSEFPQTQNNRTKTLRQVNTYHTNRTKALSWPSLSPGQVDEDPAPTLPPHDQPPPTRQMGGCLDYVLLMETLTIWRNFR